MAKAKLTPKQEHFAREYIKTSNASEAYRRAYDVGENTKTAVIWVKASEVLANGKVSVRIAELQMKAQERTLVTVESLTKDMRENRAKAEEWEQAASMQSASMGIAKLHGLLVDKVTGDVTIKISKSDADL